MFTHNINSLPIWSEIQAACLNIHHSTRYSWFSYIDYIFYWVTLSHTYTAHHRYINKRLEYSRVTTNGTTVGQLDFIRIIPLNSIITILWMTFINSSLSHKLNIYQYPPRENRFHRSHGNGEAAASGRDNFQFPILVNKLTWNPNSTT